MKMTSASNDNNTKNIGVASAQPLDSQRTTHINEWLVVKSWIVKLLIK